MKRSEMVDLMVKTERECQEYKCGRAFMQTILKKMEKAGMLPPRNNLNFNSPRHDDPTCHINDLFAWEPEDETQ